MSDTPGYLTFDADTAAVSPDGTRLATGGPKGIRVYDAVDGREVFALPVGAVWVDFSTDGTRLLGVSVDGDVVVVDAIDGHEHFRIHDTAPDIYTKTAVAKAAFSPDGSRILTAAPNPYHQHRIKLWDAYDGHEIYTLSTQVAGADGARFSPDGRRLVVAGDDGGPRVYDSADGRELLTLAGHYEHSTHLVLFSPDGTRILTCGGETGKLWNAADGSELFTFYNPDDNDGDSFSTAAFSPDGARILMGSGRNSIDIWDATDGKKLIGRSGDRNPIYEDSSGSADDVDFSADGRYFLACGSATTIPVWDARDGQKLFTLTGHTGEITSASFSSDGTRILSVSRDGSARLWEIARFYTRPAPLHPTLQPAMILTGHTEHVRSVAYSPDGTRIVTGSVDGTARVWDATDGRPLLTLSGHGSTVEQASFSSDGTRILTASWDETAKVWDARDGRELFTIFGPKRDNISAAFAPDGDSIVTGGRLWDARDGSLRHTLSEHINPVNRASYGPDSGQVVLGTVDNTAVAWNVADGRALLSFDGHARRVTRAGFSCDGALIWTASWDSTCRVWDARTGVEICQMSGLVDTVISGQFSVDSTRLLSGDVQNNVDVWDVKSGRKLFTVQGDRNPLNEWNAGCASTVAYSPDGNLFLACGSSPTVPVWQAEDGARLFTLTGHTQDVTAAVFSPDSAHIVTGSIDGTACVWSTGV